MAFGGLESSVQNQLDRADAEFEKLIDEIGELMISRDAKILVDFLYKSKVSKKSCECLLRNSVDSMESLLALMPTDFDDLGLPLGQRRLLQRLVHGELADRVDSAPGHGGLADRVALGMGSKRAPMSSVSVQAVSDPLSAPMSSRSGLAGNDRPIRGVPAEATVADEGEFQRDVLLGMGVAGEQKPYLDITQFVKRRTVGEEVDHEFDISPDDDGVLRLQSCNAKKVALKDECHTWKCLHNDAKNSICNYCDTLRYSPTEMDTVMTG